MSAFVPENPPPTDDHGRWPERIHTLSQEWQHSTDKGQSARVLRELWVLVNAAVARYVRIHIQSYGHVDAEDVRDIASEKTVAYIRSLENGNRDLGALQTSQL